MSTLTEDNSLNLKTKEKVKELLNTQGYHTYVERLDDFKLYVTDFYGKDYVAVAFMVPSDGCICINPGFIVDMDENGPYFQELSVIVRHELLHFLLCHEKRFVDYLKAHDKDFEKAYERADIRTLANFAMDYDISNTGYDDYDIEVVKTMKLNGKFIGGLLAEEVKNSTTSVWGKGIYGKETFTGSQFNNWTTVPMEDMFEMLRTEHEKLLKSKGIDPNNPKPITTIHVKGAMHSQEYTDAYNKVIQQYGDNQTLTDADLQDLLVRVNNGEDII